MYRCTFREIWHKVLKKYRTNIGRLLVEPLLVYNWRWKDRGISVDYHGSWSEGWRPVIFMATCIKEGGWGSNFAINLVSFDAADVLFKQYLLFSSSFMARCVIDAAILGIGNNLI